MIEGDPALDDHHGSSMACLRAVESFFALLIWYFDRVMYYIARFRSVSSVNGMGTGVITRQLESLYNEIDPPSRTLMHMWQPWPGIVRHYTSSASTHVYEVNADPGQNNVVWLRPYQWCSATSSGACVNCDLFSAVFMLHNDLHEY